jgi:hypothetical protein
MAMRKITLLLASFISFAAVGQSNQPALIPTSAGFVKIDDGSYNTVLLMNDSVGNPPVPNYCGADWSAGLIYKHSKSPTGNGYISTPGCWAASTSDPQTSVITFRYFSFAARAPKEFKAPAKAFMNYMFEWRTDKILPKQ